MFDNLKKNDFIKRPIFKRNLLKIIFQENNIFRFFLQNPFFGKFYRLFVAINANDSLDLMIKGKADIARAATGVQDDVLSGKIANQIKQIKFITMPKTLGKTPKV